MRTLLNTEDETTVNRTLKTRRRKKKIKCLFHLKTHGDIVFLLPDIIHVDLLEHGNVNIKTVIYMDFKENGKYLPAAC